MTESVEANSPQNNHAPGVEPLLPVPSRSGWRLTKFLGMISRPAGGSYVFSEVRYRPIRTDASCADAERAFKELGRRKAGGGHISPDLAFFLMSHGILVSRQARELCPTSRSADEWREVARRSPFVVRLPTRIENIEATIKALDRALGMFRSNSEGPGLAETRLKFIWNGAYESDPLSSISRIVRFVFSKTRRSEYLTVYIDLPLRLIEAWVSRLCSIVLPPVVLTTQVTGHITPSQRKALALLVNAGFRPHCDFRVTAINLEDIKATILMLVDELGADGFSYAIVPAMRFAFPNDQTYAELLPAETDLLALVDWCHSLQNLELSQSALFTDASDRFRGASDPFPCRMCLGRALFVDGSGLCAGCHREAASDALMRQRDPVAALRTPEENLFGRSSFGRNVCMQCPLRFLCGGVCEYVAAGVTDQVVAERVFSLHCAIRRHVILQFFEDATVSEERAGEAKRTFRLESGNGRLDIVTVGDQP